MGAGKKCGVVEKVKRQMLKWFGHMERMEEGKMTRRVYMSETEGGNVRGRPPVKWRDRVQEYVRERGEGSSRNLEQARRVCQDRERWKKKIIINKIKRSVTGFFFSFFLQLFFW